MIVKHSNRVLGGGYVQEHIHEHSMAYPLVSIIVPIYNSEKHLARCVDSILSQTYPSFELILINDGSTDGSADICDAYANRDKRVQVINQNNSGVSAARNVGVSISRGEWIGFVDSDDWIEPEMYNSLLKAAMAHNKQISICGFVKHCLGGWSDFRDCSDIPPEFGSEEALNYLVNERYFEGSVCNKLFRRDIFTCIELDEKLYFGEDLVFVANTFLKVDGVAFVPKAYYHYCMHGDNSINTFNTKRLSELDAWDEIITLVSPVSNTLERLAKFRYTEATVNILYHASRDRQYGYLRTLQKKAKLYARAYFCAREIPLKTKLRNLMIIFAPRLSYRGWSSLKTHFRITWWSKELKQSGGIS